MTWFKVDDGFWSHPKTLGLSTAAVALWVRAGSYCGKHLTDGYVPQSVLPMLQGTPDHARELVVAGMWDEDVDGWTFHDWHAYQDTREAVEKRRESWKQRAQRHREREREIEANTSSLSIPFHSPESRDSHRDAPRESRRDTPRDEVEPADPSVVAAVVADIRTQLRRPALETD